MEVWNLKTAGAGARHLSDADEMMRSVSAVAHQDAIRQVRSGVDSPGSDASTFSADTATLGG
jgi:hypothetical protein